MQEIRIPYGHGFQKAWISEKNLQGVYTSVLPPAALDQAEAVRNALEHPIGSVSLEEMARGKKSAVVITSDHTRPVPSKVIMPQILERLRRNSPDIQITILVATGFHRRTTRDELVGKLGEEIVNREKIVIHDSRDDAQLVKIGILPSGGELLVNRLAVECDLLVGEGFIEPHFFAGFSGGRKSILPGIASRKTVLANHCAEFIASPFARTGNLEGNPIHQDMLYAARLAKLAFIVNVVINAEKKIVRAFAGHPEQAHESGCAFLRGYCGITAPEADIVVTGNGGYPLDQNVYQSVKGMTAGEAICRRGGVVILCASCGDGHGGESFFHELSAAVTPQELYEKTLRIPRDKTVPDQWEYQVLCRVLMHCHVILVSDVCDHAMLRAMHIDAADSLQKALEKALQICGDEAKIAVVPDGVSVIPGKK